MKRHKQQHHMQDARRFSRTWWLRGLDTLLWVSVITILIWLYADIEFTASKEVNLTLQLVTEPGSQITLTSPAEHTMQVTLRGTQNALDRFEREISGARVLPCDVTGQFDPNQPEPKTISAEDLLNIASTLGERGIDVASARPATVRLAFQQLYKLPDVPVELVSTGAELLAQPAMVKVDVLVSAEAREKFAGKAFTLQTRSIDLSGLVPGKEHTIQPEILKTVTVDGETFAVEPALKTATFVVKVKSRTETRELAIPVQILTPSGWAMQTALGGERTWGEYVLVLASSADWKLKLSLRGSPKDFASATVRAMVVLGEEDKKPTDSWLERDVVVLLPPGSSLELVGPAPKVKFRLEKRKSN